MATEILFVLGKVTNILAKPSHRLRPPLELVLDAAGR